MKDKISKKRVINSFFSIKNSFEFFSNLAIYDMKTDRKKSKETLLRKKEIKMLKRK